MQINHPIAVIGGTGKAGQYIVRELLSRGFHLRLLLRSPQKIQIQSQQIQIAPGDARDSKAISELVNGCSAVISALGQPVGEFSIFSAAMRNILTAMHAQHLSRYIGITGVNVDTPEDEKGAYAKAATDWMRANYPLTTADKQVEWELLNASSLEWTLVRLPLIQLTEERVRMGLNLTDCKSGQISAGSLADFMVDQLEDRSYIRQSPFVYNDQEE